MGLHPHDPGTSQVPLLIASHQVLRWQHMNFEGMETHSQTTHRWGSGEAETQPKKAGTHQQ